MLAKLRDDLLVGLIRESRALELRLFGNIRTAVDPIACEHPTAVVLRDSCRFLDVLSCVQCGRILGACAAEVPAAGRAIWRERVTEFRGRVIW